jgi:hypothetical protein
MSVNVKFKFGLCDFYSRKFLIAFSLLLMITLAASCFISEFNDTSLFVLGAPDKGVTSSGGGSGSFGFLPNSRVNDDAMFVKVCTKKCMSRLEKLSNSKPISIEIIAQAGFIKVNGLFSLEFFQNLSYNVKCVDVQ